MNQIINEIKEGAKFSHSLQALAVRVEQSSFIRNSWFDEWVARASNEASIGLLARLKLFVYDRPRSRALGLVRKIIAAKQPVRASLNEAIVSAIMRKHAPYFDNVEKNPLTHRQREACAGDEDATLVIAGAGTGKTSTIVAKIGLLLLTKQCTTEEILAISFTNKSANELAERVKQTLKVDLRVSTFHKLGLDTLAKAHDGMPSLADFTQDPEQKAKHIDALVQQLKSDGQFLQQLLQFCAYYPIEPRQSWEFKTLSEYTRWIRSNKIVSLDGVAKKSFQECVIANWLILNGVSFTYENAYEHPTRTVERRQYHPDFYLPDAGIYIEHFGVDESGMPAPYINAAEYQQSMEWKRTLHRRYKTVLIETYSWEHGKGILLSRLEERLRALGLQMRPVEPAEALARVNKAGMISQFSTIVGGFLTLYKGNGCRLEEDDRPRSLLSKHREALFLALFKRIFLEYERRNKEQGVIDFEDMIIQATQVVRASATPFAYLYILIDEFQDISPARAELLKAIRSNGHDCALFAVGDDWQSIYRFAGADIAGMTRFEALFGAARQVALDTTFRFDEQSVALSSAFVLKNTVQIPKELLALRKSATPSLVVYMRSAKDPPLDWALGEIAKDSPSGASVMVLERYNFHLPHDPEWSRLRSAFPTLRLEKMSMHAAKGLEADYVVMGLHGGVWGFPSQVRDDPLFDRVLSQADAYPNGEERRLFYVALTRARHRTYLVCETGQNESAFASEILSGSEYAKRVHGVATKKLGCRRCGSGTMLLRDGSNGKFYGCSNYPHCAHTEQKCPECRVGLMVLDTSRNHYCHECGQIQPSCPKCKTGMLEERDGRRGPFRGCSNFRDPDIHCRYTENM